MLPSKQEIIAKIEYCKLAAISDAIKLNLIDSDSKNACACQVQPHTLDRAQSQETPYSPPVSLEFDIDSDVYSTNILLKNFVDNFDDEEEIEMTSAYVEIPCNDATKRLIVKKTSLCWLLRSNYVKLSSDRLERVKSDSLPRNKKVLHYPRKRVNTKKIRSKNRRIFKKKNIKNNSSFSNDNFSC